MYLLNFASLILRCAFCAAKEPASVGEALEIINSCPSYGQLWLERPSKKLDAAITVAMEKLQPLSTDTLRMVIEKVVAQTRKGTPEYNEYLKKVLPYIQAEYQLPTREQIDLEMDGRTRGRVSIVLWIDRYLLSHRLKRRAFF